MEQLIYPLAYAYGYSIGLTPPCAISVRTGIDRQKGVKKLNSASKLRGEVCTKCGAEADAIQPLFDLDMASSLIPMRYNSLKTYLSKNKELFPARYMLTHGHRRVRMLTGAEVKAIRAGLLRGPGEHVL